MLYYSYTVIIKYTNSLRKKFFYCNWFEWSQNLTELQSCSLGFYDFSCCVSFSIYPSEIYVSFIHIIYYTNYEMTLDSLQVLSGFCSICGFQYCFSFFCCRTLCLYCSCCCRFWHTWGESIPQWYRCLFYIGSKYLICEGMPHCSINSLSLSLTIYT